MDTIKDYGIVKEHHPKSQEIYRFISELDFANGDAFVFKSGGDGDNGELLMDLLDCYFARQDTWSINPPLIEVGACGSKTNESPC